MLRWEGTTKRVQFAKLTAPERAQVDSIVSRWLSMRRAAGLKAEARSTRMDLCAVHFRMPLDFERLAEAPDFEVAHDVGGIYRYLDRRTGELTDCFVPRFLKREPGP